MYLEYGEILEIMDYLDPDEVTDIVQLMPVHKQRHIVKLLNENTRNKVNFLMRFKPDSAAGIMNLNYITIKNKTPKHILQEKIKKHIESGKPEPKIIVLDEFRIPVGEIKISTILISKNTEEIYSNINSLPSIKFNEDQEECIRQFAKNKDENIIVLNDDKTILGLIDAQDIFKAAVEENMEDFYSFAGLHKEEEISDSSKEKIKFRLSWLMVNLIAVFLAAFIVGLFQETISKFVLLAAFMPVVASMGGNAGTQTTAIMIRGIAQKKVNSHMIKKIISSEITAAIVNGIVIGLIVGTVAFIFGQSLIFGIIAALANLFNLMIASIFGTLVPYILESFGYDPASSSGVFVTSATDVLGFFIFLGLASLFLI
jgi:magnesium transporter